MTWVYLAAAVAVAVLIAALMRRRRASDGVESFQRQIDALSHEARRPVVDQVQRVAEADRQARSDDDDTADDDDPTPSWGKRRDEEGPN